VPFFGSLILVAVAAMATALLFRRLGLPGARLVGGLVVGIALGPTVLGRLAPEPWAEIMMGGTQWRAAVHDTEREHAAWRFAAAAVPLSIEEMELEVERHRIEILPMRQALSDAENQHARPWVILTVLTAIGAAASGGLTRRPRRPASVLDGIRPLHRADLTDTAAVGAWAAMVPILATILVFTFLGYGAWDATTLLAAAAVGIGAWTLDPLDGRFAGGRAARRQIRRAGTVATLVAASLIVAAAWRGQAGWGVVGVVLFPIVLSGSRFARRWPTRQIRDFILLPSLAAFTVIRSEFLLETPWLLTIFLIAIAGDGRWLGWFFGLIFSGHEHGHALDAAKAADPASPTPLHETTASSVFQCSLRRSLAALDTAGPQLVVASTAVALGLIGPGIAMALAISATTLDFTAPLRRRVAQSLKRTA